MIELHRVSVEINNQVATTRIEQVFANRSETVAEGTYVFPLPVGAAVSDLVMWVDGRPIEAKILDAEQARDIYDEIVRQMRDPALLEYVGAGAIQASVFPIQPHSEVKIEIEYGQLLPVENGLVHYEYPLRTDQFTREPVEQISINVKVTSNDAISTIYSPTHPIAISRDGDLAFSAGYEATLCPPGQRFQPVLWAGERRNQREPADLPRERERGRLFHADDHAARHGERGARDPQRRDYRAGSVRLDVRRKVGSGARGRQVCAG